jgi:hypothetical protein
MPDLLRDRALKAGMLGGGGRGTGTTLRERALLYEEQYAPSAEIPVQPPVQEPVTSWSVEEPSPEMVSEDLPDFGQGMTMMIPTAEDDLAHGYTRDVNPARTAPQPTPPPSFDTPTQVDDGIRLVTELERPKWVVPAAELSDPVVAAGMRSVDASIRGAVSNEESDPSAAIHLFKAAKAQRAKYEHVRAEELFGKSLVEWVDTTERDTWDKQRMEVVRNPTGGKALPAGPRPEPETVEVTGGNGLLHPMVGAAIWIGHRDPADLPPVAKLLVGFTKDKKADAVDWQRVTGGNQLGLEHSYFITQLGGWMRDDGDNGKRLLMRVLDRPDVRAYLSKPTDRTPPDPDLASTKAKTFLESVMTDEAAADPEGFRAAVKQDRIVREGDAGFVASWEHPTAIKRRIDALESAGAWWDIQKEQADLLKRGDLSGAYFASQALERHAALKKDVDWEKVGENLAPDIGRVLSSMLSLAVAVPVTLGTELAADAATVFSDGDLSDNIYRGSEKDISSPTVDLAKNMAAEFVQGTWAWATSTVPLVVAAITPGLEADDLIGPKAAAEARTKFEQAPVEAILTATMGFSPAVRGIGALVGLRQARMLGWMAAMEKGSADAQAAVRALKPTLGKLADVPGWYLRRRLQSELLRRVEARFEGGTSGVIEKALPDQKERLIQGDALETSRTIRAAIRNTKNDVQAARVLKHLDANWNRIQQLYVAQDAMTSSLNAILESTGMMGFADKVALGADYLVNRARAIGTSVFASPSDVQAGVVGALVQGMDVQSNLRTREKAVGLKVATKALEEKYGIAPGESSAMFAVGSQGIADIGDALAMRLEQPWRQNGQAILDKAVADGAAFLEFGSMKASLPALQKLLDGQKAPLTQAVIDSMRERKLLPPPTRARKENLTLAELGNLGDEGRLRWTAKVKAAFEDGHYERALQSAKIGIDRVQTILHDAGIEVPAHYSKLTLSLPDLVGSLAYDAMASARKKLIPNKEALAGAVKEIEAIASDLGIGEGMAAYRWMRDRVAKSELPRITGMSREAVVESVALDAALGYMGVDGATIADTFGMVYDRVGRSPLGQLLGPYPRAAYAMEVVSKLVPRMFRVEQNLDRTIRLAGAKGKTVEVPVRAILDELEAPITDWSLEMYHAGIESMRAGLLPPAALFANTLQYLRRQPGGIFKDVAKGKGSKWMGVDLAEKLGVSKAAAKAAQKELLVEAQSEPILDALKRGEFGANALEQLPAALASIATGFDPLLAMRTHWLKWKFRKAGSVGAERELSGAVGREMYKSVYNTTQDALIDGLHRQVQMRGFAVTMQALRAEAKQMTQALTELYGSGNLSELSKGLIRDRIGLDLSGLPPDPMARLGIIRQLLKDADAVNFSMMPDAVRKIIAEMGFRDVNKTMGKILETPTGVEGGYYKGMHISPSLDVVLHAFKRQSFSAERNWFSNASRFLTSQYKRNLVGLRAGPLLRDNLSFRWIIGPMEGLAPTSYAWRMAFDMATGDSMAAQAMTDFGLRTKAAEAGGGANAAASGSLRLDALQYGRSWERGFNEAMNRIRGTGSKTAAVLTAPLGELAEKGIGKVAAEAATGSGESLAAAMAAELYGAGQTMVRFFGLPSRSALGKAILAHRALSDEAGRAALIMDGLAKEAVRMAKDFPEKGAAIAEALAAFGAGPDALASSEAFLEAVHRASRKQHRESKRSFARGPEETRTAAFERKIMVERGARDSVYTALFGRVMEQMGPEAVGELMGRAKRATVDYSDKSRFLEILTEHPLVPFATYAVRMIPRVAQWLGKNPATALAHLQLYRSITQALWQMIGGEGKIADMETQLPYWQRGPLAPLFGDVTWSSPVFEKGVEAPAVASLRYFNPIGGGIADQLSPLNSPIVEVVNTIGQAVSGNRPRSGFPWSEDPMSVTGVRPGGRYMTEKRPGSKFNAVSQIIASTVGGWGAAWQVAAAPGRTEVWLRGSPEAMAVVEGVRGSDKSATMGRPALLTFLRLVGVNSIAGGDKAMAAQAAAGSILSARRKAESQEENAIAKPRSFDMFDEMANALVERGAGPMRELEADIDLYRNRRAQGVSVEHRPSLVGGATGPSNETLEKMGQYVDLYRKRVSSIGDAARERLWAVALGLSDDGDLYHQFPALVQKMQGEGIEGSAKVLEEGLKAISEGRTPPTLDEGMAPITKATGMLIDCVVTTDPNGNQVLLPGRWAEEIPKGRMPRSLPAKAKHRATKEIQKKAKAVRPEVNLRGDGEVKEIIKQTTETPWETQ